MSDPFDTVADALDKLYHAALAEIKERLEAAERERDGQFSARVQANARARAAGSQLAMVERQRQLQREDRIAAERERDELREMLREKPNQPLLNSARRLVLATDNAERNAALGDLYDLVIASGKDKP